MSSLTGPDLGDWAKREVEEITQGVVRAVERTADELRDEIKHVIETNGTGRTWSRDWGNMPHGTPGRTQSAPGRVASGKMGRAVKSRLSQSKSAIRGEAGWIDEYEDYFGAQEEGFQHNIVAGLKVEGMYAIGDAAARAPYLLDQNLDKEIK